MRYYKEIVDGYVIRIGIGVDAEEISEQEYNSIMQTIGSRPQAPDGYGYRLREDLTWELYELPPMEETLDNEQTNSL